MLFRRSFSAVSVVLATFIAGAASAQTTLKLAYTPAGGGAVQTCTYTTDGNNVTLEPATGALTTSGGTFGSNCPTSAPVGAPSFTDPVAGDVPANVTTGATASINWKADADSCIYDGSTFPSGVTFASWPTSGQACNSQATCAQAHPLSLTLSANGAYKFKLTCSKTGNPTTVISEANTVASTTSAGCVAPTGLTRQTIANVCGNGSYAFTCRSIDVTKFENVFGYNMTTPSTPLKAWPGSRNLAQRIQVVTGQYVSLQFTVPANFGNTKYGLYQLSEDNISGQQGYASLTVSKDCGDFKNTSAITSRCLLNLGGEQSSMIWSSYSPGNTTYDESCHLTPGETYYLNVVYAPLIPPTQTTAPASTCAGQTCDRPILNAGGSGW